MNRNHGSCTKFWRMSLFFSRQRKVGEEHSREEQVESTEAWTSRVFREMQEAQNGWKVTCEGACVWRWCRTLEGQVCRVVYFVLRVSYSHLTSLWWVTYQPQFPPDSTEAHSLVSGWKFGELSSCCCFSKTSRYELFMCKQLHSFPRTFFSSIKEAIRFWKNIQYMHGIWLKTVLRVTGKTFSP